MDYEIAIPSYIKVWKNVQAAEKAGFTHSLFYDSQLVYSSVWANIALAAENTKNKLLAVSLNPNLDGNTEKIQVDNVVLCDPLLNQ